MQQSTMLGALEQQELVRLLTHGGMPELFHKAVIQHVEKCVLEAEARGIKKGAGDIQSSQPILGMTRI